MSIQHNGEETYQGCVLEVAYSYRHVHSDNAMIDSGRLLHVRVWADDHIETVTYDIGRTDNIPGAVVDASDEVVEVSEEWERRDREAVNWLTQEVRSYNRLRDDVRRIVPGKRVEITRGRKAPKGIHVVEYAGSNQYGDFIHTRCLADGVLYKYIKPEYAQRTTQITPTSDLKALIIEYAETSEIGVLCDYLEENGDPRHALLRVAYDRGERFSRNHIRPYGLSGARRWNSDTKELRPQSI